MITLTVTAVSTVDAADNISNVGSEEMTLNKNSAGLEADWKTLNTIGNLDYPDKYSWAYSDNSCQDVESTIRTLWGIVTQAVGTGAHTFVNSNTTNNITVTE